MMDKLFIPAKAIMDIRLPRELSEIEGRIGLLSTVQYLHLLETIAADIPGSIIGGQILGCNIDSARRISKSVDSFLYIGSGRFHPIAVAKELNLPVYTLNPSTGILDRVSEDEIKEMQRKEKRGLVSFFSAKKVGLIVTTKHGQSKLALALDLKGRMKDKEVFIFLAETINPSEFENHKVDCLVNTACPRMIEDEYPRPLVAMEDILPLYP